MATGINSDWVTDIAVRLTPPANIPEPGDVMPRELLERVAEGELVSLI